MAHAHDHADAAHELGLTEHFLLFLTFIPRGWKLLVIALGGLAFLVFIVWLMYTIIYWRGAAHEHDKMLKEAAVRSPAAASSTITSSTSASAGTAAAYPLPAAEKPVQPAGTILQTSAPPAGLQEAEAPAVKNSGQPNADENYSAWIPDHVGYRIYLQPDYPNPNYSVQCWDAVLQKPVTLGSGTCQLTTGVRVQSTTGSAAKFQYGYLPK